MEATEGHHLTFILRGFFRTLGIFCITCCVGHISLGKLRRNIPEDTSDFEKLKKKGKKKKQTQRSVINFMLFFQIRKSCRFFSQIKDKKAR